MRNDEMAVSTRILTGLIVAGSVLVASCSGGDDSTTTIAPDPSPPVTEPAVSGPGDTSSETSAPATTVPPPDTTAAATTTTEPPPELLPIGAVWSRATIATAPGAGMALIDEAEVVGDTLWFMGSRSGGPALWRSTDAIDFEEIVIGPAPSGGRSVTDAIVATPSGRLVVAGSRSTDCDSLFIGLCRFGRPTIHLSDDGGATWRSIEPDVMAPAAGGSAVVEDIVVHGDEVIAAITVRGQDWHGRLVTSPDGENWSVAGEYRGQSGPMSLTGLLSDGTTLAVIAADHPCSEPSINTPGWILGSQWPSHQRVFVGNATSSLAPLTNADLPIVPAVITYDCTQTDGFDISREDYPWIVGAEIGGRITLMDASDPPTPDESQSTPSEDGSDEEDDVPIEHVRRTIAQLVDGVWVTDVSEIGPDGPPRSDTLVDVDGQVGLVRTESSLRGVAIRVLVRSDDGWVQAETIEPVTTSNIITTVGFGGRVVASVREDADLFDGMWGVAEPADFVALWSTPTAADEVRRCALAPGAVCRFQDLSLVDGYPDFAGLDLSGVDLLGAVLGEADFTGANLSGARLARVDGDEAGFADADLTGADLRDARLGDLSGAVLSLARLDGAQIEFDALPVVEGADLRGASLRTLPGAPPLSLAGLDLTDADVRGAFDEVVVISDVTGAVLDGVLFQRVDLRGTIGIEAFDLTTFDVWDDSICPDGLPPTDGPIGTCAR